VDLAALASRHLEGGALVTLAVAAGDTARYGGVEVDDGGRVRGFVPAGDAGAGERGALRHFVGVQAVEAAAFDAAPEDGPSESVGWLYPRLIAARADAVQAFETAAEFLDVGTACDYLDTVRQVAAREGRPLDVGDGCVIDPSARLAGSILWDHVRVGAGADLEDCIVADGVVVPSGLRCRREMLIARGGDLERRPFP
jgi:NDP-sugar pyrophosphorylase family protein